MSNKAVRPGMKSGVTEGRGKGVARLMEISGREIRSDTSNQRRSQAEKIMTKSNKKYLDLTKISSRAMLRHQRSAIKATGELVAKPTLLSRRAEASNYDKSTRAGTQLKKSTEQWGKPKLSPLPRRNETRDIGYLQRPSSPRSLSHEDFNQRNRSTSEPVCALPSTPKDSHQAPKKETRTVNISETSLPKITIDEIFQSWNVTPTRGRAGTLNSDPMELLRRDWALSNPVKTPSYKDLLNCRYLRSGKSDKACAEQHCSCNSCEHVDGLRKYPFMS